MKVLDERLALDLKRASERAEELMREFWRGRPDAEQHGRCFRCGWKI